MLTAEPRAFPPRSQPAPPGPHCGLRSLPGERTFQQVPSTVAVQAPWPAAQPSPLPGLRRGHVLHKVTAPGEPVSLGGGGCGKESRPARAGGAAARGVEVPGSAQKRRLPGPAQGRGFPGPASGSGDQARRVGGVSQPLPLSSGRWARCTPLRAVGLAGRLLSRSVRLDTCQL